MDRVALAVSVWILSSIPVALVAGSAIGIAKARGPLPLRTSRNVIDLTGATGAMQSAIGGIDTTNASRPNDRSYRASSWPTIPSPVLGTRLPSSHQTESQSHVVSDT